MANFTKNGGLSMKNVPLVATVYPESFHEVEGKDGKKTKLFWVDFMAADPENPQINPHLRSTREEDGRYNHGVAYTEEQLAVFMEAANGNAYKFNTEKGTEGVRFALEADVFPKNGHMVVNPGTAKESSQKCSPELFDNIFEASRQIRAERQAQAPEAQAEAPQAQQEVQGSLFDNIPVAEDNAQAEADEPQLG